MKFTRLFSLTWSFLLLLGLVFVVSCSDDDEPEPTTNDPTASFQFAIDENNFLTVSFTNFSQNASTYAWNFGDGNSSTEKDPTHTYAAPGSYEVTLTAANADGKSASFSNTIEIKDPDDALALLAGTDTKTWKLFREGTSLGVGPDADNARQWFALSNDGSRPCVYKHEFTFNRDGSFIFDDMGEFWGEAALYDGTALFETCFEAIPANMVNKDGADISAFLSGTHQYSYDPAVSEITLTGTGAWMGLPQLGTSGESTVPEASKTFTATITEETGYDLLHIAYDYGDLYWDFTYVSYSDPSLEPELETEEQEFGEDLVDMAPTEFFNTFASTDPADVQDLVHTPDESSVTLNIGVDDPADAMAAKVGEYVRGTTDPFSDLKFVLDYDIQFDNFTEFSIDVYMPSSNTYEPGGLAQAIQVWIADKSQTEEFWTNWVQYDVDPGDIVLDEWKTYTFPLGDALNRMDLDMVGLSIGGSNHNVDGTFYIRNFTFQ